MTWDRQCGGVCCCRGAACRRTRRLRGRRSGRQPIRHDQPQLGEGPQRIHLPQSRARQPQLSVELRHRRQRHAVAHQHDIVRAARFLLRPRFPALPTTVGWDVIFGNTTAGNTTAVSTNFNVSTQETSAFYRAPEADRSADAELLHPSGLPARTFVLAIHRVVSVQQGRQMLRLPLRSAG